MARSSTRYRKRHKRRGGSGSDSEASSQSSSSPETLEEEAAGAEESGAGPGQDGDTTDSDDEGVLGVCYSWAKKWTGTRGGQPIRGRTLTEQRKFIGKSVATSWGCPGRVWTGTVIGIYNATEEFDEYERDLYTIRWEQREDEVVDADDQAQQDVEFEELQPASMARCRTWVTHVAISFGICGSRRSYSSMCYPGHIVITYISLAQIQEGK
jgi:hypothetical protein